MQTCRAAKLCKCGSDEVHNCETKTVPVGLARISTVVISLIEFIFDIEHGLLACPHVQFMWACCHGLSASPLKF